MRILPTVICFLSLIFMTPVSSSGSTGMEVEDFFYDNQQKLSTLKTEQAFNNAVTTHLFKGYGDVSAVMGFADALSGGHYKKEVEFLLKEEYVRTIFRDNEFVDVFRRYTAKAKQKQPLTTNINKAMTQIGYLVSGATLAADIYQGLQGNNTAKLNAIGNSMKQELAWIVGKIDSRALNISMASVGFIDYALNKYINEAFQRYDDLWWQAYSRHLNQYPMVKGERSWVRLYEREGMAGIQKRLYEFWDRRWEAYGDLLSDKHPQNGSNINKPMANDAMAESKKKIFAAQYMELIYPTLLTYFKRQAEQAELELLYKADRLYEKALREKAELEKIQQLILQAREMMKEQETVTLKLRNRVFDENFLPVYKDNATQEYMNGKTYYEVTFDAAKRPLKVIRYLRGIHWFEKKMRYEGERLVQCLVFKRGIKKQTQNFQYGKDGALLRLEFRDAGNRLTGTREYTHNGDTHGYRNHTADRKLIQWYAYKTDKNNRVYRYEWHKSDLVYYQRRLDPGTGYITQSTKYENGIPVLTQKFFYDRTGLLTKNLAYESGSPKPFSNSTYRKGSRLTEYYTNQYRKEIQRYEYFHDRDHNLVKRKYYRRARLVATLAYDRYPDGNLAGTKVYDKRGGLVYDFPGKSVYYIHADGSDKEGAPGKQIKETALWDTEKEL